VVCLTHEGRLAALYAACSEVRHAKAAGLAGAEALPLAVRGCRYAPLREARRLAWWRDWIDGRLADLADPPAGGPVFVAVEDYAYRQGLYAHQIGEVAGLLRRLLWERAVPFRAIDPMALKLASGAAAGAVAEKVEVVAGVAATWGVDFARYGEQAAADLADAYVLARLALAEQLVARGLVGLDALSAGERRVFLRTTRARPLNLLSTPLLCPSAEDPR
jgi:hypothetical protein